MMSGVRVLEAVFASFMAALLFLLVQSVLPGDQLWSRAVVIAVLLVSVLSFVLLRSRFASGSGPSTKKPQPGSASADSIELPEPVRLYFETHPDLRNEHDLASQQISTTRESFFTICKNVMAGLNAGDHVTSTDNVSTFPDHVSYWSSEGLQHLRINFDASGRDIVHRRFFLLSRNEFEKNRKLYDHLFKLHSLAGVNSQVAFREDLPPECVQDFAIWGPVFSDQVLYNLDGSRIIGNQVFWDGRRRAPILSRLERVENHTMDDLAVPASRAHSFEVVKSYSQRLAKAARLTRERIRSRPVVSGRFD